MAATLMALILEHVEITDTNIALGGKVACYALG
jgi:hypothetical protein